MSYLESNINDKINLKKEIFSFSKIINWNSIQMYECGISNYGSVDEDPESNYFQRTTLIELAIIQSEIY